ncbi:alpha/beta hydrolase [Embleya sp. MST-111070]|uniref:alpha/beta hydrolase n=1 Tax=Embleya sp. MST-111070 TaxID=3398231 RepID=UPI003F73F8D1
MTRHRRVFDPAHESVHEPTRRSARARWRALYRRTAAVAAVALAMVGGGVVDASANAKAEPEPGEATAAPTLAWSPCVEDAGFECANASVPLDYREPDGRRLTLAVIRHRAADPTRRLGTLVLQPGGPGNSGVDFVRGNYASLPAELRERFDVFGFDARGIGRSAPYECWDDATYSREVAQSPGRPGPDGFDRAVSTARDFDAACAAKAGDVLPFMGTDYVARDLDLLRRALGERRLSFYGRSFGSYIGTVYADRYPGRVRAMALDGAYDPVHYAERPYEYDRPQYLALDAAMGRFLDWCSAEPVRCGFGQGDARGAFERLMRELDAHPVPTPSGVAANGYTLAYRLMFNINGGKAVWPAFGAALRQAELRDGTAFLLRPPSAASFDFLTANVVVECIDRAYPRDPGRLERNVRANVRDAPLLGPPIGFGPPTYDHNHAPACAQWSGERVSRHRGSYRAWGSAPILVLGTTGDPDTPYQDAVALSERLDNARLLTFRAEGHTAFGRSTCAQAATVRYLTDLTLPPRGTVCADEPDPVSATVQAPPVAGGPGVPGSPGMPGTQGLPGPAGLPGVDEGFDRIGG